MFTKNKKVCETNPIPQQDLEMRVIDVVLGFHKPCLGEDGREKIVAIAQKIARFLRLSGTLTRDSVNA